MLSFSEIWSAGLGWVSETCTLEILSVKYLGKDVKLTVAWIYECIPQK